MAEIMNEGEAPTTPTKDDRPPATNPSLLVDQDFEIPPPPPQALGDLQPGAELGTGEESRKKEETEQAEAAEEDDMIRLRRAAATERESLPLLHPTPDLHAGPPSYTPPATSTASTDSATLPFSTSIMASSSRKRNAVPPPAPLERIPSSTSDDFGDFVDAPPSAVPVLSGDMDPLTPEPVGVPQSTTSQDPLHASTATLQDPLMGSATQAPAPPPPLDPLSLPSSKPQPQLNQTRQSTPWSSSTSSEPLLPPTPALSSPAPPPPPKSSRPPTNLVDEVLRYEEGGLSLFSNPAFTSPSSSSSSSPPAPPPKSPSPLPRTPSPLPPPPHHEWNSRTATPTPTSASGVAYTGGMLSPTPLHHTIATPPNTAAHAGGVFKDHPLAPSPGAERESGRERSLPRVTTPHLPPVSLSGSTAASASTISGHGTQKKGEWNLAVEQQLKRATSPHAETEIIAHHLGLIDDDYFSSREPADASALAIPVPPSLSRSRSRSSGGGTPGVGGLVGSLGSLLTGGGGGSSPTIVRGREGQRMNGSGRELGHTEQRGTSRGREHSPVQTRGAAPPVMSSGGEWDWGSDASGGHEGRGRGHGHGHTPSPPRRTSSSSGGGTLGGLWGLWKGASPSPAHAEDPHGHGQHEHGMTTSPQPIQPIIVEGQPAVFESRSSETSLERGGYDDYHATGSVGVQGRNGRPLPKARTSLESIQQRWMDHGDRSTSHSHSGGLGIPNPNLRSSSKSRTPSPSRTRRDNVRIDPPTITHVSPFAPPPSPPNSAIFTSASLNAGFGDPVVGLVSSSIGSTSSLGGIGSRGSGASGSGANPFGSHTFVPIAGAPGFRPEGYDWDKGFSEELERELGSPSSSSISTSGREREKLGVGGVVDVGGKRYEKGYGVSDRDKRERELRDRETGRGRQRRPEKEREPSIYQTIGSKFGLWGSSSTPYPSSSGASSSSSFNVGREKGVGGGPYNGHGRSATTPSYSSAGVPVQERAAGERRLNGKKVGELIERKVGGVELKGRKESTVGVLGKGVGDKLRAHLPPLSRLPRTWTLLYSMDQHGISLNTLYTLCEAPEKNRRPAQPYIGMGGHILVIRDDVSETDKDSCFGVYVADGLSRSKAKGFYGGGDSFLFKYHAPTDTLEVFHPTGRNTYYALCEAGYMAFGGGSAGSGYALWVGDDLLEGTSSASGGGGGTFGNNEVLCFGGKGKVGKEGGEREVEFEVVGLEVWGVGPT